MVKKITLLIFSTLLYFISANIYSQDYLDLYTQISGFKESYEFDEVDCEIIEAADYLLSLCYDEDRYKEDLAYLSVVKWMDKTFMYHIIDGGRVKENCPKNSVLSNISRITMTKYLFQNDSIVQKRGSTIRYVNLHRVREVINGGAEIFMEYLSRQEKATLKSSISKDLNKGLKLYKANKLEEFMKRK